MLVLPGIEGGVGKGRAKQRREREREKMPTKQLHFLPYLILVLSWWNRVGELPRK